MSTPAPQGRGPLPERAADTTAEQPWPVRLLSMKIGEYVEKMSTLWVEGQVVQLNRRPGARTAYLTLRDPDVDMSLSVSIHVNALDAMPGPLERGRPRRAAGQAGVLDPARLADARRPADPPGRGRRAARPARVPQATPGPGGPVRPRPQAPAALPPPPGRAGLRAGQRRRARRGRERPPPLAGHPVRDPPGRRAGRHRGGRGDRRPGRARRAPRGRRHRHRPRRRRRRGPPAVQQRDPGAGGGRGAHPGRQRDRPRRRHPAARPRRRPPRLHPHRRRQGDRAGCRRRACRRHAPPATGPGGRWPAGCTTSAAGWSSCAAARCSPTRAPSCAASATSSRRCGDRARRRVESQLHRARDHTAHLRAQVRTLSPQSTLDRGYAIVQQVDGSVVSDPAELEVGELLRVRVARGDFAARPVAGSTRLRSSTRLPAMAKKADAADPRHRDPRRGAGPGAGRRERRRRGDVLRAGPRRARRPRRPARERPGGPRGEHGPVAARRGARRALRHLARPRRGADHRRAADRHRRSARSGRDGLEVLDELGHLLEARRPRDERGELDPAPAGSSTRLFCTLVSRTYLVQVRPPASRVPVLGARLVCASTHSGVGSFVCSTAT